MSKGLKTIAMLFCIATLGMMTSCSKDTSSEVSDTTDTGGGGNPPVNQSIKKVKKISRNNGNIVEFVWEGNDLVALHLEDEAGCFGKIEYEYADGKVSTSKIFNCNNEEIANWNYYYNSELLVRQEMQFQDNNQSTYTFTFNLSYDSQNRPTGYSWESSLGGSSTVNYPFVWDGGNVIKENGVDYVYTYNNHPNPLRRIWMGCEQLFPNPMTGPFNLRAFFAAPPRDVLYFSENLPATIVQEPGTPINYANYVYDSDGYPTRIAYYDGSTILTIEYAE